MEGGDSEKEEVGCALRSSRRKANVSFSNRSRPPPFLLFLPLTTRICRFIKSDVYNTASFEDWHVNWRSEQIQAGHILLHPSDKLLTTWYAEKVIKGDILASKKVILAAKRHVKDLKRQGSKAFPWIFVEEKGYRPIRFIEKFCKPDKGKFKQMIM